MMKFTFSLVVMMTVAATSIAAQAKTLAPSTVCGRAEYNVNDANESFYEQMRLSDSAANVRRETYSDIRIATSKDKDTGGTKFRVCATVTIETE